VGSLVRESSLTELIMGITWLASFPKSGNTWVRFLLYNYLFGSIKTSGDINRRIPAIHRESRINTDGQQTVFVKTHFVLTDRHPLLDKTDRAIYIKRHPKDILLSGLNYHRMTGAFPEKATDQQYAQMFISRGADPIWIQQGFGTWDEHLTSWTQTDRFPVHITTYERLKHDTAAELEAMLRFSGFDPDPERVAQAVKASEFDQLRALEVREKASGKKDMIFLGQIKASRTPRFFMNQGKTGQSLAKIGPQFDAMFDQAFADAMRRHGYA